VHFHHGRHRRLVLFIAESFCPIFDGGVDAFPFHQSLPSLLTRERRCRKSSRIGCKEWSESPIERIGAHWITAKEKNDNNVSIRDFRQESNAAFRFEESFGEVVEEPSRSKKELGREKTRPIDEDR